MHRGGSDLFFAAVPSEYAGRLGLVGCCCSVLTCCRVDTGVQLRERRRRTQAQAGPGSSPDER